MSAPRSTSSRRAVHVLIAVVGLAAFVGLIALGNWQLERRQWKLELMERVGQRVDAPAVAAPLPAAWPGIHREADEYRHIQVRGQFLADSSLRVAAASELGSGYWLLTPLRSREAGTVLINRGYIAQGVEAPAPPQGEVVVSGLLRLSEPGGGFLRDNRPQDGRWYSRDVVAMAEHLQLPLAPYFIDAKAAMPGSPGGAGPVGGLTVVRFHNSHLVYALTWYGLAAMVVVAGVMLRREARKRH